LPFSAILLALGGFLAWEIWSVQVSSLEAQGNSRGNSILGALIGGTRSMFSADNRTSLEQRMRKILATGSDLEGAVAIDLKGNIVASTDYGFFNALPNRNARALQRIEDFGAYEIRYRPVRDERGRHIGTVGVRINKKDSEETSRKTTLTLIWTVSAVMTLVGLFFALFVFRIRQLGATLEERVKERTRDLSKLNERLQREVQEKWTAQEALASARDEALRSTELKSRFLANMSHEIRTPINGVLGINALLLERELDGESRELAETVSRSAQSLLGIVNDILDFSKIEAGKISLETTEFSVPDLFSGVAEVLALEALKRRVEVVLRLDPGLPAIAMGDQVRVRQVLMNLVSNAVKFSEEGSVTISAERIAGGEGNKIPIRVAVRDTGMGIPKEFQASLFSSFEQADGSITRKFGGTGLGLAISKSLVQMMGGDLRFRENTPKGSVFEFEIMLRRAPRRITEDDEAAVRYGRVLICERHPESRGAAKDVFEEFVETAAVAADLDEAAAAVAAADAAGSPFDLILTDMRLASENGVCEPERIFARVGRRAPVVGMCFLASANDAEKGRCRFSAVLRKPIMRKDVAGLLTQELSPPSEEDCSARDVAAETKDPAAAESRKKAAAANDRIKVLLVEDNQINRRVAIGQLDSDRYIIETAGDGIEALERFEAFAPDLILMDCQMPKMDGYQAAKAIRQSGERGASVPIVAMTAHAMVQDRIACMQAGMDDHIPKPTTKADMLQKVGSWTTTVDYERLKELDSFDEEGGLSRSLLESLLGGLSQRVEAVCSAFEERDWSRMRDEAHALKGTAGNLGVLRLSAAAAEFEFRADNETVEGTAQAIARLTAAAREFREHYETKLREVLA
jgi:signal transduction histidine kinase/DNA-binding response OmpR family regulator